MAARAGRAGRVIRAGAGTSRGMGAGNGGWDYGGARQDMVEIKNDEALDAMREAGRVVARCLAAAREVAAPGVSLIELDKAAHDVIRKAGATSPFLNYHPSFAPTPFPAVICASVNDAQMTAGNGVGAKDGW